MGGRQNTFPKRPLLQGEGLESRGASIQQTKRNYEASSYSPISSRSTGWVSDDSPGQQVHPVGLSSSSVVGDIGILGVWWLVM